MADDRDAWEKTAPAEFFPDGGTGAGIKFPILSRDVGGGNRLQKRERPWRHGAKVDTTGSQADEYEIEAVFHNDIDEDDLGADPPLWPDRLNALIAALKSFKTATLNLPWERNIRVKAATWKRSATSEMREGERLRITFIADNEDKTDAASVKATSIATAKYLVEQAKLDAPEYGNLFDSIGDLVDGLNELAAYPSNVADDVSNQQRRIAHECARVREAMDTAQDTLRQEIRNPRLLQDLHFAGNTAAEGLRTALASAKILELQDMMGSHAGSRQRRTTRRVFKVPRDIYSIAAELQQDPDVLLALNPQLEDPAYIPPGTVVIVLA